MPPRRSRDSDTIVVDKDGDDEWAAPSSPESIGSDIDFAPRNKMAVVSPQNLESPEPELADDPSIATPTSASKRYSSSTPPKYLNQISFRDPNSSTMEERLQMMPAKRTLPWREGVEAGSEIETGGDSRRKQIRFGCLLATRGNVVEEPCLSCANARGKFTLCIALPGFFKGACASCQLSGRPNRCSIKTNEEIEPDEFTAEDGIRVTPEPESSSARRASGKNTVKETPDRSSSKNKSEENNHSGPPAKKARVEEPEKPIQTGWQEPPVVDTGLGSTKARGGRPPRSSLTSWAPVNSPHMATRNSSTPNTRNGGLRKSVGKSAEKESIVKEPTRKASNTPSVSTPQSAPSRPASTTWASVNQTQAGAQPTFPNLPRPQIPKPQHQQSKPEQEQDTSDPKQAQPPQPQPQPQAEQQQPPQTRLQQHQAQVQQQQIQAQVQQQQQAQYQSPFPPPPPVQHQPQHQPQPQHQHQHQHQNQHQPQPQPQHQPQPQLPHPQFQVQPSHSPSVFAGQQQVIMSNGSTISQPPPQKAGNKRQQREYQPTFVTTPNGLSFAAAPLIETLPKRKQLQLMGIISGLQGGIDNIQRELNALKKTLGVEDDDI
ncbi:hypothetical protein BofuT4_P156860.1 [Botrytis cinerea T4]|uniref:Uncharacterized protein n=1 Tax=Botryotinia fuckeliana (strain T4) TaxID=999810 RepID=G2YUJ2_BOTF4|nr:hypothetical protein BofuT4_P156860.1 [Botrytis cinerea T4]